ncbi:MAG: hypothetical protein H6R14_1933 [Proteobacteria bacterium]|nr:hypothetical protein [Pseudomonadota bacterium]
MTPGRSLPDLLAGMQRDLVLPVPVEFVEDDFGNGHFTGEDWREQDAVVVRVRLGAEDGDVVLIRGDLEQFLDGADTGHAVADQDETRFDSAFSHAWLQRCAHPRVQNLLQRMTSLPSNRRRWRLIRCSCRFIAIRVPADKTFDFLAFFPVDRQRHAPSRGKPFQGGAVPAQLPPMSKPVASTATMALAWLKSSA